MAKNPGGLFMKTQPKQKREWFRVDNAWQDDGQKTADKTVVYIYDEIGGGGWFGGTSADDFVQMLSTVKTPEIELHLNCPGGEIFDGLAIYNSLVSHPANVTVVVDALAASAASFIAQAGDEIVMTTGAMMMIHDGSGLVYGPAAVMRETAELLDKLSNNVAGIYAKHAGKTTEFWRNLMIEEVWYNADEAVAAGLASKVGDDTAEEDKTAAQNKWDLSVFSYASRDQAPDPIKAMQRMANLLEDHMPDENETPGTGSPETDPNAQTTEGQAQEVAEEEQEEAPGETGAETPGAPAAPAPAPAPQNSGTGAYTFVVNGAQTTDMTVVQNRLNMLEQFRTETLKNARVAFVEKLAEDKKISAPQIDALTKYALSLNDEGYAAWSATYADAPQLGVLSFEGAAGGSGSSPEGNAQTAELESCKDIVTQHKLGGLKNEAIMRTASYKRLMELDPTFKL